MSVLTSPRPPAVRTPRPASLLTLTGVELRKSVDTRAGRWLLAVIGLVAVAAVVLQVAVVDSPDQGFAMLLLTVQFPVAVLLPVVGILLVTSEWSQRSALPTFTLEPRRQRVIIAKLLAAVLLTLLAVAASVVAAAAGHLAAVILGGEPAAWSTEASSLLWMVLFQVISMLVGLAFGLALLSSPLAIVLYFVVPTGFTLVTSMVDALREPARWLDLSATSEPLLATAGTAAMDAQDWAQLGTSLLLWLLLPLAVGTARVLRADVQ